MALAQMPRLQRAALSRGSIHYKLRVTGIGRQVKVLYLGTETTWEARLPQVLERAKAVRLALLNAAPSR
jgi:hypothetical protein